MKLAVLGAGGVGSTLGDAWRRAGHDVTYGLRRPERYAGPARATGIESAVAGAAAVLIALPGAALADLLERHGSHLDGHLLLDATNRVGGAELHQLHEFAERTPRARVARVFCTVGVEVMAQPGFPAGPADLLWCGPRGTDAAIVELLVADVGLHPVRVGGLDAAPVVDGAARLWFALVAAGWGRHHGVRILGGPA